MVAEALSKRGVEVRGWGHRPEFKGDLEITHSEQKAMVEITKVFPRKKTDRSSIKGYEILGRFYYALKLADMWGMPAFVVLHRAWKDAGWIKRERKFLQERNVYLLFTSFEGNWGNKIADEIIRKMNCKISHSV